MKPSSDDISKQLLADNPLTGSPLVLRMGDQLLALHANSSSLLETIAKYFSHIVVHDTSEQADIEVIAIDGPNPELALPFRDWPREQGKQGRKDAIFDLNDARLVHKVRTGLMFLQRQQRPIAAGRLSSHPNQLINFINSQHMNQLQQQGWLICHAAGLTVGEHGLGIAGFSGGGKSTLMLHLMEAEHACYVTNDRLFIRQQGAGVTMTGIPKLPRINPGTIVHNPRLRKLLSQRELDYLQSLPAAELWHLEQKYDAHINDLYGPQRIVESGALRDLIILNWGHDRDEATQLREVSLSERRELLHAIMKSPGPFYQNRQGDFLNGLEQPKPADYLAALEGVQVWELTGRIDFEQAVATVHRNILESCHV